MTQPLDEHYKNVYDIFLWKWKAIRSTRDEKVASLQLYKKWIDEEIERVKKGPASD
jgi:hypothetical protein